MDKLNDILNKIDEDELIVFTGKDIALEDDVKKMVVLFTHELSSTGAPIALQKMAKWLKKEEYAIFIVCHRDGELRDEYINAGINVIIYENYMEDVKWCEKIYQYSECFVFNTLAFYSLFSRMNNSDKKVIWWIHEQEENFKIVEEHIRGISPGKNSMILAAGPYVKNMIKQYMGIEADILNIGVADMKSPHKISVDKEYIEFLNVGLINENKGQHILVEAIEKLSEDIKLKARFTFCGDFSRADMSVAKKILQLVSKNKNVKLIDQMSHNKLSELYDKVDSVIVTSREEATSAIMVEGLMKEKIGICSDTCGITHYLESGVDSFIYPYGDSDKLAEIITYTVNNIDKLEPIRKVGRRIYEEVYSENVFEKRMNEIINWTIRKGEQST